VGTNVSEERTEAREGQSIATAVSCARERIFCSSAVFQWNSINVLMDKFGPLLSNDQLIICLVAVTLSFALLCFISVY
jgi:hypothetical protein